jgi:ATP-dependent protease ClpP protease subunit
MALRIYGVIVSPDEQKMIGELGQTFSSKNVIDYLEANKDKSVIDVRINSGGGSVSEGFLIFDLLRNSGKEIHTVNESTCASIATVIFCAANRKNRKSYQNAKFLIHYPYIQNPEGGFTSQDLQNEANKMKEIDNQLINFYSENLTSSKQNITSLMKQSDFFGADVAKEIGLISGIYQQQRAFAYINFNSNNNMAFLDFFKKLKGEDTTPATDAKNQAFVGKDGTEIQLAKETGFFAVGDQATPDGEFVVTDENGVDQMIKIEAGVVTEVMPAADMPMNKNLQAENDALRAIIKDLETKNKEIETAGTEAIAMIEDLQKTKSEIEAEKNKFVAALAAIKSKGTGAERNEKFTNTPVTGSIREKLDKIQKRK